MAEATPTWWKFFLFLVATWFGQLRGGDLRFLSFASSRAAKICGDLAKIYGASPQSLATVSGLSFAQRAKSMFSESSQSSTLHGSSVQSESCILFLSECSRCRVVGKTRKTTHPTVQTPWRPLWTGFPRR